MTPEELRAQTEVNQMNMNQPPPSGGGISSSFGECPQCGFSHPPLPEGAICPNAKATIETGGIKKELNIEQYLVDLRNIILSQISSKSIKNPDKLFQNVTIEVAKYLETYSE